jgi:hypothetical protein
LESFDKNRFGGAIVAILMFLACVRLLIESAQDRINLLAYLSRDSVVRP